MPNPAKHFKANHVNVTDERNVIVRSCLRFRSLACKSPSVAIHYVSHLLLRVPTLVRTWDHAFFLNASGFHDHSGADKNTPLREIARFGAAIRIL